MSVDQTHVRESIAEEIDDAIIHYFVTSEQGD